MKRCAFLLIASAILSGSVSADDFDKLYEESAKRVSSFTNMVAFGSVNPTWTDSATFYYYAWDGKDFIYYRVDINAATKTTVPRDTADSYTRARQQRTARGDFAGWNGAFGGRTDAGFRSPDNLWEKNSMGR